MRIGRLDDCGELTPNVQELTPNVQELTPNEKELTMETYIRINAVQAEPMDYGKACLIAGLTPNGKNKMQDDGYLVIYADGYRSWCPKGAFDACSVCVNPKKVDKIVDRIHRFLDTVEYTK